MHSVAAPRPRPRPIPLPRKIPETAVDRHRDVWCRHYDDCLDQACQRNWTSWSCQGCPLKGQAQVRPELRTGGDSVLVEAQETALGYGTDQWGRIGTGDVRPPGPKIWARLSSEPRPIEEIAEGYLQRRVREVLMRFARLGTVELVAGGWRRTGCRTCSACRTNLPITAFSNNKAASDGKQSQCRPCLAKTKARWRARDQGRRADA